MSGKKNGGFTAFIKYTVTVEVPLKAPSLADAAMEAVTLKTGDVHSGGYDVMDFGESAEVTGVFKA